MNIGNKVQVLSVRWIDKSIVGNIGNICKVINNNLYGVKINNSIYFLLERELKKL